jgi:biopolymer transport protein ExbD
MEMTPLIDVVFLLLTFFVLSIVLMVRADAFDIELPEAAGEGAAQSTDVIDVVLNPEGGVRVDGEPVAKDRVVELLMQLLEARPEAIVRLAADENSRSGDFIRLQKQIWGAGIRRVSILTSGEEPEGSDGAGQP